MIKKKQTLSEDDRYYENLKKSLLEYMGGKNYSPLSEDQLIQKLQIPPRLVPIFVKILKDLAKEEAVSIKTKKYTLAKKKTAKIVEGEVITGVLRLHPRGFGFLQPDKPIEFPEDVFIPKHLTDGAVDGDTVEVEINPHAHSEKGPEGKVLSILKRGRTHLAGIVQICTKEKIQVYSPLLGSSKPVLVETKKKLKEGDRVILKMLEWGDERSAARGEMSHLLGHISDPSIDNAAAIEEFDLQGTFPKKVVEEAKKWGSEVSKKELKNREDFSKWAIVTIDPETAKDFDDALSLTVDKKGHYHLGVHIADVAYYVSVGSELDKEAQKRCNSTYFPGFCLPMLPHELSDQLCSLRPDEKRLTVSVLMEFDKEGTLVTYRVCRSFIKSKKRFSYEEAKEVLDGKKKSVHAPLLKRMVELCALLKKKRQERGSIDFALPELVIKVNEKGEPLGTHKVEYDITHQLVEEYMLKANEMVAKHLADQGKPVVFRIHEEPSAENMQDFYTLARSLGFTLPKEPTQQDLQALFEEVKQTPHGQQLSVGFIRSMKLANYSESNIGHFGLALEHYCHFTSPIRRYTDLIIQRLLFGEEGKDLDLAKVTQKCSEQERISFKAETSVKSLKKLRLLKKWVEEDPSQIYDAVVTKVKPFGLFFEIPAIMLEGFLHVSELENDYFIFHPEKSTFTGRSTGTVYSVGKKLHVKVVQVDLILLESKWELAAVKRRSKSKR